MIRMTCEDCHTLYYSAAARVMVEQGQRCAKCGGRLVLDEEPPGRKVGANAEQSPTGE